MLVINFRARLASEESFYQMSNLSNFTYDICDFFLNFKGDTLDRLKRGESGGEERGYERREKERKGRGESDGRGFSRGDSKV